MSGSLKNTVEHNIWQGMIQRCHNPRNPGYKNYGARGISVSPEWRKSFRMFLDYINTNLGKRPSTKHSIDRIDNNGNYEPKNIRWATRTEQNRNLRKNVFLKFSGKTLTISAWAELLGIKPNVINSRIKRGWSIEEALTVSSIKNKPRRSVVRRFTEEDILNIRNLYIDKTSVKDIATKYAVKERFIYKILNGSAYSWVK